MTLNGSGIYGGTRFMQLNASGSNPYQQPIQVQVRPSSATADPSSFIWSVGYGVYARIDLIYGQTTALNLNLTAYDRLRISFSGLTTPLNFNLVAWQGNGMGATCGINLSQTLYPFTVDFPLSAYVFSGGVPLDWSNIQAFDVVFQGGPNLAITEFSAVPKGTAPASFSCASTAAKP